MLILIEFISYLRFLFDILFFTINLDGISNILTNKTLFKGNSYAEFLAALIIPGIVRVTSFL